MKYKTYKKIFAPANKSGKILVHWWSDLQDNRGARANLRRARTLSDIMFVPEYHRLYNTLHLDTRSRKRVALIAGVCSCVEENTKSSFVSMLAAPRNGAHSKPVLSGLCFRQLLAINEPEELHTAMVGIVGLLGKKTNICDMARTLYWWGNSTKQNLAFKYYAKAANKK